MQRDVGGDGFLVDGAVDGGIVSCGNYEEVVGDTVVCSTKNIARSEGSLMPGDLAAGGHIEDALAGVGGDDGDVGVRGAE